MSLERLGVVEAAALIREKRLTSEALVTACLERIAAREPQIQAWTHLNPAFALEQARAADQAIRDGRVFGPLHGVPIGVKDIIDTVDFPTENGSDIFAGRRPAKDAAVVTALKRAGAVILGKTVTTELAFFTPGKTRNPASITHTPGGSSSGSAAAVADFHAPLALGTQTAGSILRPASFCGAIGFKPTYGLIPRARDGVLEQSAPLDTIGGFARSLRDITLLFDCLASPAPAPSGGESPRKERLAFVKSPAWPLGEETMKAAFAGLLERLGGAVEQIDLPLAFSQGLDDQRAIQFRDIAANYGPLLDAHPHMISEKLREIIGEGRKISLSDYDSALARREPLYTQFKAVLNRFDAILTPASAGPAPSGLGATGTPAFNALWTYLGAPAISLPLLEANGLPLGVQIVGARNSDHALFDEAKRLAALCGASMD